jgi:hypothetical protein
LTIFRWLRILILVRCNPTDPFFPPCATFCGGNLRLRPTGWLGARWDSLHPLENKGNKVHSSMALGAPTQVHWNTISTAPIGSPAVAGCMRAWIYVWKVYACKYLHLCRCRWIFFGFPCWREPCAVEFD